MHALTDLVQFRRPPAGAGNRLVLTKKLPGTASADRGDDDRDAAST